MSQQKQTFGSRSKVMHGNAKKTTGGLTKSQLKYNKQGKIVSKKASALAKKNNRLVKSGYATQKGVFGNGGKMRVGGSDSDSESNSFGLTPGDILYNSKGRPISNNGVTLSKNGVTLSKNIGSIHGEPMDDKMFIQKMNSLENFERISTGALYDGSDDTFKTGILHLLDMRRKSMEIFTEISRRNFSNLDTVKKEDSNRMYELKELIKNKTILGYGSFGLVFKGSFTFGGVLKECAVKTYTGIYKNDYMNHKIYFEAKAQKDLQSIYVPRIYGYNIDKRYYSDRINSTSIIMELIEGISLFDFIEVTGAYVNYLALKPRIGNIDLFEIVRQIAQGIQHIHSNNYALRDLNPDNILLSFDEETLVVKFIDFGGVDHEDHLENNPQSFLKNKGTEGFQAPEQLHQPEGAYFHNISDSQKTDMYSFGEVIRKLFFTEYSKRDLKRKFTPPIIAMRVYNIVAGMVDSCKIETPEQRPSIDDFISSNENILVPHPGYKYTTHKNMFDLKDEYETIELGLAASL